jgi:hypothetical protein
MLAIGSSVIVVCDETFEFPNGFVIDGLFGKKSVVVVIILSHHHESNNVRIVMYKTAINK